MIIKVVHPKLTLLYLFDGPDIPRGSLTLADGSIHQPFSSDLQGVGTIANKTPKR